MFSIFDVRILANLWKIFAPNHFFWGFFCPSLRPNLKENLDPILKLASWIFLVSSEWVQKSTVRNPNFESLDQCQIFAKSISLIFVVNELFLSFKIAILEICLKKDGTNFEKKLRFGILNSLTLSLSLSLFAPPPANKHFRFIIVNHF